MKTIKLEIILAHANNPILGCPVGTIDELNSVISDGYIKEDKGGFTSLTPKGIALVENIRYTSELFEKSHGFHTGTIETYNKVKENTLEFFNKLRNNTGDLLYKVADTIKK